MWNLEQVNQTSSLLLEFINKYSNSKYSHYVESLIGELGDLETQYQDRMEFEYTIESMRWFGEVKILMTAKKIIEEYVKEVEKEIKKDSPLLHT